MQQGPPKAGLRLWPVKGGASDEGHSKQLGPQVQQETQSFSEKTEPQRLVYHQAHQRQQTAGVFSADTDQSQRSCEGADMCVCGGAPNEMFTHIPREANRPPTYPPTSLPSPNQLFSISLLITDSQGSTDTI